MINKSEFKKFDYVLFLSICAVFFLGLFSMYSASFQKGILLDKNFVLTQLGWMAVGMVFFMGIMNISYIKLCDFAYPLYAVGIFLLLAVLFTGRMTMGAQRWLNLGIVTIQPSEFAKIVYILALAQYLGRKKISSYTWKELIVPFGMTLLPMILILKQPDLGTSLIFLPILFSMLLVWGIKARHLLYLSLCGLLSTPLLWTLLKDYQKKRLLVFVNPNVDPLGAGYTVIQSKIAIGSGGLFGKGWLSGTQSQLNFLPERHTDFIFSVVGEEWGFIGAGLIIFLFFVFVKRGLNIAEKTNNLFGKLLATGIVTMFAFQIVVNIGMTMGFMPVVGLPLPFVSYGGSSLVSALLSVGILLNIGMRKPVF